MRFAPILVILTGIALAGVMSCVYIVDERRIALVLEFGRIKTVVDQPGMKFKWPSPVNTVEFYDKRILPLETQELEVTPLDNRRLRVTAFARYRITDPERFYQAVRVQGAEERRLEQILTARLREVLGTVSSEQILSAERSALMRSITEGARAQADAMGVSVVDVRIQRADLPQENLEATYNRMRAEREQEAADERARGREAAQVLRAQADRQAVEVVSQARKQSEIVRGEADAERNRVFAEAYGRNPEFFAFYRSLSAYERALQGDNSTIVLSPDSEFFDYLRSDSGVAAQ